MEREKKKGWRVITLLAVMALVMLSISCVKPVAESQAAPAPAAEATPVPVVEPAPAPPAPVASAPSAGNPYAAPVEKMTTAQCGSCHTSYFQALKNEGGRHQFDCVNCHVVYHAYNPNRNNWAEIMPKCESCHTLPHGPTQTECLSCHSNPHKPVGVPLSDRLTQNCASCHAGPAAELQQFPSKHTLVACVDCHSERHGNIPSCFVCHEGHYPEQPLESCLPCHPVHKPRQIVFTENTELKTCSGCHAGVYGVWSGSQSKHAQVSCVACHEQHAMIPQCSQCHGEMPHNASLHAKFPDCLTCHLDPHDPPVKTK
ncbi:MAG: hypothetical protein RBT64_09925 [Trichloromonas sp.]|nr:hypothetical protein [Trichloromonas sp.]